MASSLDYLQYVLELLRDLDGITYKKMMGEYMLYQDGVLFGGIYDNRFLIKKTKAVEGLGLREQIPYPSAKEMLLMDSENPQEVADIILKVVNDLKQNGGKSWLRF